MAELLRKVSHVEDYIWPGPARDWLEELAGQGITPEILDVLIAFRELVRRWLAATLLPVDQIVLTIAQDLLTEPAELAVSYKLAVLLHSASQTNPDWRLFELTRELDVIAKNQRRFIGFSQDDLGFDPEKHRGKVVVGTIHKAKGLEWDRVYLMSVNNYDFPSGIAGDRYLPERWYLRSKINLEAEALAQLKAVLSQDEYDWYDEGQATIEARLDYVRERLRLFYVGITRAKKELVITWNTGRLGDLGRALPFVALKNYWDAVDQGGG
jgi:DNA helicase II / ATP-dependent DNA helicase PcrA